MCVVFTSHKQAYPLPNDARLVFYVTSLTDPTTHGAAVNLELPGFHPDMKKILESEGKAERFFESAKPIMHDFMQEMREKGETRVVVVFVCRGGRHRSPYCANIFAKYVQASYDWVKAEELHPELDGVSLTSPNESKDAPRSGSVQRPIKYRYEAHTNMLHDVTVTLHDLDRMQDMYQEMLAEGLAGLQRMKKKRKSTGK